MRGRFFEGEKAPKIRSCDKYMGFITSNVLGDGFLRLSICGTIEEPHHVIILESSLTLFRRIEGFLFQGNNQRRII